METIAVSYESKKEMIQKFNSGEVNGNRFWSNSMDPRRNGARDDHDAGR